MISSIKDSEQLVNLVNQLKFNPTNVSDYAFITDLIKVPIFSFFSSTEKDDKVILEHSKKFINEYCDAVSHLIDNLDTDYIVRDTLYKGEIRNEYMSLVNDAINRTGRFKEQHELALQLSHYNTSLCIQLRAAMIIREDYIVPTVVAILNLEAINKFDRKLNKILELDLIKLT